MSERAPEDGDHVVVQASDGSPVLFFGLVRDHFVRGVLECSPRPIPFRRVYRWFLVPTPPDVPGVSFDDDIPFSF